MDKILQFSCSNFNFETGSHRFENFYNVWTDNFCTMQDWKSTRNILSRMTTDTIKMVRRFTCTFCHFVFCFVLFKNCTIPAMKAKLLLWCYETSTKMLQSLIRLTISSDKISLIFFVQNRVIYSTYHKPGIISSLLEVKSHSG